MQQSITAAENDLGMKGSRNGKYKDCVSIQKTTEGYENIKGGACMMNKKLKMSAKTLIAFCILATCFLAIGCSKSKDGFEKILTSSEWNYYDYSGCNESFACDEDRNFAYYCEGGSPVGDF